MNLPVVNVFSSPYQSKTNCIVSNHVDAAKHLINFHSDIGLENFIDDYLASDPNFKRCRAQMPSRTPKEFSKYQKNKFNPDIVDLEINKIGLKLGEGQVLFRGGEWPDGQNQYVTTSPLSTSFCSQVALLNALYGAKAYMLGRIDLMVLRVKNPITNVFVFRQDGRTRHGNEKEVLFASGATLTIKKQTLIRSDYPVIRYGDFPDKQVPVFLIEADIS